MSGNGKITYRFIRLEHPAGKMYELLWIKNSKDEGLLFTRYGKLRSYSRGTHQSDPYGSVFRGILHRKTRPSAGYEIKTDEGSNEFVDAGLLAHLIMARYHSSTIGAFVNGATSELKVPSVAVEPEPEPVINRSADPLWGSW